MSLLTPNNLNSTLPIPNGSLLKKIDDDTFIEATQADIIALGFVPWSVVLPDIVAWTTHTLASLIGVVDASNNTFVPRLAKSVQVLVWGTYTVEYNWARDFAWGFDPIMYTAVNGVQVWPNRSISTVNPVYTDYSEDITVSAWDTIETYNLSNNLWDPSLTDKLVITFDYDYTSLWVVIDS